MMSGFQITSMILTTYQTDWTLGGVYTDGVRTAVG